MKEISRRMQVVKKLINKAKKSNTLTYKKIMDELEKIKLNPE